MTEILYEDEKIVVVISCTDYSECPQLALNFWTDYVRDRELKWHNVMTQDGIHQAMSFARGSAHLAGRFASLLHAILHIEE